MQLHACIMGHDSSILESGTDACIWVTTPLFYTHQSLGQILTGTDACIWDTTPLFYAESGTDSDWDRCKAISVPRALTLTVALTLNVELPILDIHLSAWAGYDPCTRCI